MKKIVLTYAMASATLFGCVDENTGADKKTESGEKIEVSKKIELATGSPSQPANSVSNNEPAPVAQVLSQITQCSPSVQLRTQALPEEKRQQACQMLQAIETKFHQTFQTRGKPVADDNNTFLRANIYHTREDYVQYAPTHFNMTTDNGGMYLEGHPEREGNQAEFVAYERNGEIWNLRHEFVHYLDGRFNLYGDFCNGLHDDHSEPEACPSPHRPYPHAVWWGEGVAEYIAKNDMDEPIKNVMEGDHYRLSEIFNTSYHENAGTERVYRWGYLAVRYMMEKRRTEIDKMLDRLRVGDFDGYQQVVAGWGTSFDDDFEQWLKEISQN